ncbi:hypothetical protein [Xanthobacter autotrophicus]|uniref:hypothetical protein n=1 Tax=Xanthobacter autotrophicus TaxID=280 RepID=UPI0037269857
MIPDFASQEPIEFKGFDIPTFEASLNAHGMYETMRFVLRLSPRNHALMGSISSGLYSGGDISPEAIRAYSTYLHETVHWWQHVGSTSGLLYSLSYLGQSLSTISYLRESLRDFGPKKSLFTWTNNVLRSEGSLAQEKLQSANVAVNNALDIEFYKAYASNPKRAINWLHDQIHFESVGHGYYIAYGQLIGMLQAAVDPDWTTLPGGDAWDVRYQAARDAQVEGFYHNSIVRCPPIGIHAIYEGQARFAQLQYLNGSQGRRLTFDALEAAGFFEGVYVEAFDWFLKLSESDRPVLFDDPLVSLFLLVLDLSINPTRGFPYDIDDFETFIEEVDVGVRFFKLCRVIPALPDLKGLIKQHSRQEYVELGRILADAAGYDDPMQALATITSWKDSLPGVAKLMDEQRTFEFDSVNLPVRVFFSHFIAFVSDKLARPEFFCWPGMWKTGQNASKEIMDIWLRHLSLFSDQPDKPGVYPRRWPNRDDEAVKATFERFYDNMVLFDLTRQWILKDGPFICDYEWLMENYSQERAEEWANHKFLQVYGVSLNDFELCTPVGT